MIRRSCPICSEEENSQLYAESSIEVHRLGAFAFASRKEPEYMHHRLLYCRACDIIYASPIPEAGTLAAEYRTASYDSQRESRYAAKSYIRALTSLRSKIQITSGALDIGAGDGAFCSELIRAGFTEVVGLEPSSAPRESADASIRGNLVDGMFIPGLFAPESFSLITCFQTIEHVDSPMALSKEAYRLLKPGGAFCLVAHDTRAVSARVLGKSSPIFDIEHLQLFSRKSIGTLLESAGFRDVSVSSLWNTYPISYWNRLFPFPAGMKRQLRRFLDFSRIGRIPVSLPAGNLIAWGFRHADM